LNPESVVSCYRESSVEFSVLTASGSMVGYSFLVVVNSSTQPRAIVAQSQILFHRATSEPASISYRSPASDFNSLFSVQAEYRYLSHRPPLWSYQGPGQLDCIHDEAVKQLLGYRWMQ